MLLAFTAMNALGGNGAKAYQCVACEGLITHSDRLIHIGGTNRHLFTNPAGVECDFFTFNACQGAMALGQPTKEHTWFAGYAWRMAFCRLCGQHLGWHYEAVLRPVSPLEFWGILSSSLVTK